MNYAEIGKKVKSKYPQYKDMSDEDVGKKYSTKYGSGSGGAQAGPSEREQLGIDPITYGAGKAQEFLGQSQALPIAYSILGGMGGGIPGAFAGGATGKGLQQWLAQGQVKPPSGEQAIDMGKEGLLSGLFEGGGQLLGKGISSAYKAVKEPLESLLQLAGRQATAQVLQPTVGQLTKDLAETGISETLEEAQKRGIKGTAREMFVQSKSALKTTWDDISKFLKSNADDLPKIDMKDITSSLDDEIARLEKLRTKTALNQATKLKELKKTYRRVMNFDNAYDVIKNWGEEARSVYQQGKQAIDVKPYMTKSYKLLADKGRQVLKESTEGTFDDWSKMMSDYKFYSDLKIMSKRAAAKGQTAISSVRGATQRVVPWAVSTARKAGETAGGAVESIAPQLMRIISQLGPRTGA